MLAAMLDEARVWEVFNDCAEWDYLSAAVSPEGEQIEFGQMSDELQDYEAPEPDWYTKWGFR